MKTNSPAGIRCAYIVAICFFAQIFFTPLSSAQAITLESALDTSSLTWTTGGDVGWFGEQAVYHDGGDAAQSGSIMDNQQSYIQTVTTGPATVRFYYRVSSEQNGDLLRFYLDEVMKGGWSGALDWTLASFGVSSGTHTLKWSYIKDGSVSVGADAVWIDSVTLGPEIVPPGKPVNFQATRALQVQLTWAMPGDDGYSGDVSSAVFQIKYSSNPSATVYTAENAVSVSTGWVQGATWTYTLSGLNSETLYRFWLRVKDNVGNWSVWSDTGSAIPSPFTNINAVFAGVVDAAVSWGDYDNDGDLDLAVAGAEGQYYSATTKIYRNDNGIFTDIHAGLMGVTGAALAWGDFDNDGDLDLAEAGLAGFGPYVTKIYQNNNGIFTDVNADLAGVYGAAIAWGDYDNDGYLDLAVAGNHTGTDWICKIYRNNKGKFADINAGLIGVGASALSWGDYDNDGDLDLAVAGYNGYSGSAVAKIYRNDSGLFADINAGITGVIEASLSWGDYDNDGDLDLAVAGQRGHYYSYMGYTRIYRNDNGIFTDINAAITGVREADISWGDYDNDGDLDLAEAGLVGVGPYVTKIYQNNNGAFMDINAGLVGIAFGSLSWGDYDNDGDLDLAVVGSNTTRLYQNRANAHNNVPVKPVNGFGGGYNSSRHISSFTWNSSSDAETPVNGLHYEILIATVDVISNPDWYGPYVVSVTSGAGTGAGEPQNVGNYSHGFISTSAQPGFILRNPLEGATYYWKVRAIDTGLAKSYWSDQQVSFIPYSPPLVTSITPNTAENTQKTNVTDLAGSHFRAGATVKLTRSGQADIIATGVEIISADSISCLLPTIGVSAGVWDVVVTNTDGQYETIKDGFTISQHPPTRLTPYFTGLSTGGFTVSWDSIPGSSYVAVLAADSGFANILSSGSLNATTTVYANLSPYANYYFKVKISTEWDEVYAVNRGSTRTLAVAPSALSAESVFVTSAAISWGLNNNTAVPRSEVYRSTDNSDFMNIFTGWILSFSDAGLSACTTYYFKVRNLNDDGTPTDYSSLLQFLTNNSMPLSPNGLSATSLAGNKIHLAWEPSPSVDIIQYKLYYDGGAGGVNYSSPLAVLSSSVTFYTTDVLSSSASYTFALRAVNRCGVEEGNTRVLASAAAFDSLTGVRAAIKEPRSGKKVSGNSLTVMAEIIQGEPFRVADIRFQYKASASAGWLDIIPANVNHPNPDSRAPYFVQWDVTGLAPGNYDLRAVASDNFYHVDAAPPAVTVMVDANDYDVKEMVQGDGKTKKEQVVNNSVVSVMQAASTERPWMTKISIPASAVSIPTATLSMINNPFGAPVQDVRLNPVGQVAEINLSNSQHLLSNGQAAEIELTYPDVDGDGLVDGTAHRAEDLKIYSYDASTMRWKDDLMNSVDQEHHKVIGRTRHFSYFAVFAPVAVNINAACKMYPNPWKPGSGGIFDAGGVTFANLDTGGTVRIFTIAGELVRELDVSAADSRVKVWDGKNSSGSKVASGVYLVRASFNGTNKILKLAVER